MVLVSYNFALMTGTINYSGHSSAPCLDLSACSMTIILPGAHLLMQ
jgi:hypothetical protein